MTEAEEMHRRLCRIADHILKQLPWQAEALNFLNDISFLLYAWTAGEADFIPFLRRAERRKLTESILDVHTELRQRKAAGISGEKVQRLRVYRHRYRQGHRNDRLF